MGTFFGKIILIALDINLSARTRNDAKQGCPTPPGKSSTGLTGEGQECWVRTVMCLSARTRNDAKRGYPPSGEWSGVVLSARTRIDTKRGYPQEEALACWKGGTLFEFRDPQVVSEVLVIPPLDRWRRLLPGRDAATPGRSREGRSPHSYAGVYPLRTL